MGVITPTNKEVVDFKGLHLFHAGVSNCSMRVRLTLEEKQLPWTSHHVDLFEKENLTVGVLWYQPERPGACFSGRWRSYHRVGRYYRPSRSKISGTDSQTFIRHRSRGNVYMDETSGKQSYWRSENLYLLSSGTG